LYERTGRRYLLPGGARRVRQLPSVPDPALELAQDRAWPLLGCLNRTLEAGAITEQQWYEQVAAAIVPAYLAGANPRAQSGSPGHRRGLGPQARPAGRRRASGCRRQPGHGQRGRS
jgi:hypothetical protein